MTYELAAQLRDVGFPQKQGEGGTWIYPDESTVRVHLEKDDGCYMPTLSELIEACGEDFNNFVLMRNGKLWSAGTGNGPFEGKAAESFFTPEEAVANLYLSLNGNTKTEGIN
jgi:hypothetical protein